MSSSTNTNPNDVIQQINPKTPPPVPYRHRKFNWLDLRCKFTQYAAFVWFRIPLSELPGETTKQKQNNVISNATSHDLKVQTTVEGEFIYVRKLDPSLHNATPTPDDTSSL